MTRPSLPMKYLVSEKYPVLSGPEKFFERSSIKSINMAAQQGPLRSSDADVILSPTTEMLYVFSCEWNYRPDHCMYGQLCALAKERGVKIVHGCRRVFHNEKQPTFKAVYDSIKSYDFSKLEHLDQVMQRELKKAHNTYCGKEFECMLKGLKLAIQKA